MTKPTPTPTERQKGETAVAFEAFRTYLEQGPSRSTASVARALGKSKTLMDRWSSRWGWVERARAGDSADAGAADEGRQSVLRKAAERQAQEARLHATANTRIGQELVRRLVEDPQALAKLDLDDLVRLVPTAARAHNRAILTERLALGQTTGQQGEVVPREEARAAAARLTDEELDERLAGVDDLAQARAKRQRKAS